MKALLLALLGGLLGAASLRAEPSPPMGLLNLYVESQAVVIGKVIRLEDRRPGKDFSGKRVTLKIGSVLKGPLVGSEVIIQTGSTELCPPDATYEEGGTYLAFLRSEDGKKFWTTGLAYGAKPLNEDNEFAYRARLQELAPVLALPEGDAKCAAFASWYLQCALTPATRQAGLRDLDYWDYWGSFEPWADVDDPRGRDGDLAEPYGVRHWKYLTLPQVDQLAELLVRIRPGNGFYSDETATLMRIIAKRLGTRRLIEVARRYKEDDTEAGAEGEDRRVIDLAEQRNEALRDFQAAYAARAK